MSLRVSDRLFNTGPTINHYRPGSIRQSIEPGLELQHGVPDFQTRDGPAFRFWGSYAGGRRTGEATPRSAANGCT